MNNIGKYIRTILWLLSAMLISYLLVFNSKVASLKILDSEFLFTSLGVLLGFAFTLLTFIISMLDKIKEQINKDERNNDNQRKILNQRIGRLYKELKDDIYFIFVTFIIVGLFLVLEKIDLPFSDLARKLSLNKMQVFAVFKFAFFLLNLYVIYDLLSVTFAVSDTTGIVVPQKDKRV